MTIINLTQLEFLRGSGHKTTTYLSVNEAPVVWSASLSIESNRFDTVISFSSGSGNVSMIREGMEVWVGSTGVNSYDKGTVRLREFNTGDGGVTGTLTLSANNFDFALGDTITIKLDFRPRPLFPKILGTPEVPIFTKDQNITYTDQNLNRNPVVLASGNRAMWLSNSTINPHFERSYVMNSGATITNYSVTALHISGSSPTISINGSTGVGTITFNSTGHFWLEYIITCSNSAVQKSYRFYRVHDITDMPMVNVGITSVTGDWSSGGFSASITPYADTTLTEIPEETQAIIWQDVSYGASNTPITLLPDTNDTTILSGYFRNESINRNIADGTGDVSFQITTLQELLGKHFMFSQSIEAVEGTPTEWYEFTNDLTVLKGVHNLWKWQSNVMEIVDVIGLADDFDLLRPYVEFGAGDLFSMANSLMQNTGIRYQVVSDRSGSIHCTPDLQLLTNSERSILTEVFELQMDDSSEQEVIIRKPVGEVALVRVSGFSWDGTFKSDCPTGSTRCPNSVPYCSVSGDLPDDYGKSINNFDRQTLRSQNHANEIAGRKFGDLNNLYPEVRLKMHGNYFGVFDPAFPYYYTKEYQQTDTIRGFTITNKKLWLRNVTTTIDPLKGTSQTDVVLEVEVEELDGIFDECVTDFPNNSGETPTTGISGTNCGEPIYTAGDDGFERFYNCTTPVWDRPTDEITYDMRVDPYYWSRPWRCGEGYIKRSEDWGTTWIDVTPINPPNDAGDIPAPTSADLIFEHMDVSYPNEGEYIFLANQYGVAGEHRVWIVHTLDNGVTWNWSNVKGRSVIGGGTDVTINVNTTFAGATGRTRAEQMGVLFGKLYHHYETVTGDLVIMEYDGISWSTTHTFNGSPTPPPGTLRFSGMVVYEDKLWVGVSTQERIEIWRYDGFVWVNDYNFTNIGLGDSFLIYIGWGELAVFDNRIYLAINSVATLNASDLAACLYSSVGDGVWTSADASYPSKMYASKLTEYLGDLYLFRKPTGITYGVEANIFHHQTYSDLGFTGVVPNMVVFDNKLYYGYNYELRYYDGLTDTLRGTEIGRFIYMDVLNNKLHIIWEGTFPLYYTPTTGPHAYSGGSIGNTLHAAYSGAEYNGDLYIADYEYVYIIVDNTSPYLESWDVNGLGIALGRNSAIEVYCTFHDAINNELYLSVFDTATLTESNKTILKTTTTGQVNNRTYWAYPVTDWFDDDICYIHGRFSYPNTLNHSIKTIDGGSTWVDNGADVGNDHISSLFNYLDGTQQVVRNKVSGVSQLYLVNNGVLNFRSNIPFLQWVNPHSQAVGAGGSYFGSKTPQTYMVSKTVYPLINYANYTFNHQISGEIKSVEVPK